MSYSTYTLNDSYGYPSHHSGNNTQNTVINRPPDPTYHSSQCSSNNSNYSYVQPHNTYDSYSNFSSSYNSNYDSSSSNNYHQSTSQVAPNGSQYSVPSSYSNYQQDDTIIYSSPVPSHHDPNQSHNNTYNTYTSFTGYHGNISGSSCDVSQFKQPQNSYYDSQGNYHVTHSPSFVFPDPTASTLGSSSSSLGSSTSSLSSSGSFGSPNSISSPALNFSSSLTPSTAVAAPSTPTLHTSQTIKRNRKLLKVNNMGYSTSAYDHRAPRRDVYTLNVRATGLPKKDRFGLSDPYIVIKAPIPGCIIGNMKTKDRSKRKQSMGYDMTTTLGGTALSAVAVGGGVAGVAVGVALAPVAIALAPVGIALGARAAIKHATKLHPQTPGFQEVFVSEYVKRNLAPTWEPFTLSFDALSKADPQAFLLIECYDWDRMKSSDFIGCCTVDISHLLSANGKEFELQLQDGQRMTGILHVTCQHGAPADSSVIV